MAILDPDLDEQELIATLSRKMELWRIDKTASSEVEPSSMLFEQTEYTARTANAEVDTVEICPVHPDFMVFGTYSLVGKKKEYEAQVRKGSVHVLPVSTTFKPSYAGMLLPKLASQTFSAAVLDIRFHPKDQTLLGVATSDAKVHFFRFIKRGDILGRRVITELLPLGTAAVAEPDEHGLVPLVTQFTWIKTTKSTGNAGLDNMIQVTFAITLSSSEIKVVRVSIPGIKSTFDPRLARPPANLATITADVQQHDLEAWTVAAIPLQQDFDIETFILLSGADDSKLVASMVKLDMSGHAAGPLAGPPLPLWTDKNTHSAGVTAILPLVAPSDSFTAIPLLTGSYDETIRLFELDATSPIYRRKLVADLGLQGGVWRLKLMDCYKHLPPGPDPSKSKHAQQQTHYLILASCMHAGVKVLRITYTHSGSEDTAWKISVEAEFKKGHETLLYACDFRKDKNEDDADGVGEGEGNGQYTVVSTSFYDKQICVWKFVDGKRSGAVVLP